HYCASIAKTKGPYRGFTRIQCGLDLAKSQEAKATSLLLIASCYLLLTRRVAQRLPGRQRNRLGLLLYPQRGRLGALVDGHHHDDAAGRTVVALLEFGGAVDGVRGDRPVVAGRPPVKLELREGVFLVLVRMLLPVRIGLVDGVRGLIVLAFEGLKEFVDHVSFRPVVKKEVPDQQRDHDHGHGGPDYAPAPPRRPWIVFFCV